jgi:MFS family permease
MPMADDALTTARLKTPSAAAIAGLLFSVLLIAAFALLRSAVPADRQEPGEWLRTGASTVALAINLIPFAGIAFLWFIGVLRDRLGPMEDRFFATIFLGSGLLFLSVLFLVSAFAGGILVAFEAKPEELIGSATFHFARAAVHAAINIYLVKMASVFMFTASTVFLYTGITPRSLAIAGYLLALLVLFGSYCISWSFYVFPLWVSLISIFIIIDNVRQRPVLSAPSA